MHGSSEPHRGRTEASKFVAPSHGAVRRVHSHRFLGREKTFLCGADFAFCKAFFNWPKDWIDIGGIISAGGLDGDSALGTIVRQTGPHDERVEKFRQLLMVPREPEETPNTGNILDGVIRSGASGGKAVRHPRFQSGTDLVSFRYGIDRENR